MLIAARESFAVARKRGWTNPYVTDGLIAMWDGEWNAGGGKHDTTVRKLVDLSGNGRDATLVSSAVFGSNFVRGNGSTYVATFAFDSVLPASVRSVSACCDVATPAGTTGRYSQCLIDSSFSPNFFSFGYDAGGYLFLMRTTTKRRAAGALGAKSCYGENPSGNTYNYRINGDSASSVSGTLFDHTGSRTSGRIGGAWGSTTNDSYPAAYFRADSKIHSIRIYNRVLTAAEVAAIYAIDKERFNLP